MQKSQEAVTEFMRLYGQALPEVPTIPDEKTREMRVHSLAEEVGELAIASGCNLVLEAWLIVGKPQVKISYPKDKSEFVPDINEIADALVDIQYFVDGTANAYGLDLMPLFDEVHRANMNKLWTADELENMEPGWSATKVIVTYSNTLPPEKEDSSCPVPVRAMYIVKRPDGKVMKPPGFKPADLSGVLERQKCRHDDAG